MKGDKILTAIVALALLMSTMVVMNRLDVNIVGNAGAQPGFHGARAVPPAG